MASTDPAMRIAAVILAGGTNRRMGGKEKTFLVVDGVPMLARIAQSLAGQCAPIMLSINGDPSRFAAYDIGVIADTQCRGPMAGLASALDWFASAHPAVTHVLSAPGDTPFLPDNLGARLAFALEPDTFAACAASGGRLHPVVGLWPLAARHALHQTIGRGALSFHAALEGKKVAQVEWGTQPRDPFFNVNTPEDLARAEVIAHQVEPIPQAISQLKVEHFDPLMGSNDRIDNQR